MRNWKIAGLIFCILATPGFANLITNGSFELGNPNFNVYGFQSLSAPDTFTITGWTVGAGSVDYIGPYWQAAHGQRSLDLAGLYFNGSIFQTFPTTVGVPYLVTFALAGNPDVQPRMTAVQVWVHDGSTVFDQATFNYMVNGQTRTNMGWTYVSWTFTAQSSLTTLGFTSLDTYNDPQWGYSFGPALDDVRVTAIPEPATLALVGLGLIGAGFLRRRR
jgi:choice-of-anchor C domain-containing protein